VSKRVTLLLFSLIASGVAGAQEIKRVPIQPLASYSGGAMFARYCAACHGATGQGNGPAAAALTKRPADLTQLSRKNGGSFPEVRVFRYIKGSDEVEGHANRDMPSWGEVIRSIQPNKPAVADMRILNVERYVETLQAK
jgi:mono/diheme cytochrome c family protein